MEIGYSTIILYFSGNFIISDTLVWIWMSRTPFRQVLVCRLRHREDNDYRQS